MPFANNQQNSRELFKNRKEYKNFSLSSTIDTYKNEKLLVGKIDLDNNSIIPKNIRLKQIENTSDNTKNIRALDFVCDAFNSMTQRFKQNASEGKLIYRRNDQGNFQDFLTDLRCYKGYQNFLEDYSFYITGIFSQHLQYLKNNESEHRKILNFIDFINHFNNYLSLNEIQLLMPSQYYRSHENDRSTTGLVLDIGYGDCSDDLYKVERFHSDPNYPYINRLANAFGFYFDKNVPWRMIADVNSPQMKYYIMSRNTFLTSTSSFSTPTFLGIYFDIYNDDYENYIKYLSKSYNNLVRYRDSVKNFIDSKCSTYPVITKRYEVPEINLLNRLNIRTHSSIIKTYINIKNKNSRLNYNSLEINKIYNYSISLLYSNKNEAISFIDNKFNNLNHFEGTINYNNIKDSYMLKGVERDPTKDIASYIKIAKLKES